MILCLIVALGLKAGMPSGPHRCNKCKVGQPAEGDTWCVGCSGLEVVQSLLGQRWQQPGVRQIAEETVLNAARLVRAFSNLDRGLGEPSAGRSAAAERRSVPPPPPVPDRPRGHRERSRSRRRDERPPLRRADRGQELHPKSRAEPPAGDDEELYFEEESEEEEEEATTGRAEERPTKVKEERGSQPPPEPKRSPRKDRSRKKTKKQRGGRKHQRHWREVNQPLRRSHRKLRTETLELATSARAGLERRI